MKLNNEARKWARRRIRDGFVDNVFDGVANPSRTVTLEGVRYNLDDDATESGRLAVRSVDGRIRVSRAKLVDIAQGSLAGDDVGIAARELLDLADEHVPVFRRGYTGGVMPECADGVAFPSAKVELRVEGEGDDLRLRGYAAVFDSLSEPLWFGREKIAKGAFARSIAERADVIACLEHEGGLNVLARTTNRTLTLREDDVGLAVEINAANTQTGRDTVELVRRGDLYQMSFLFRPVRQEWDETADEEIRTLLDVDLFDVSVVAMPAYRATSVEANSRGESDENLSAEADIIGDNDAGGVEFEPGRKAKEIDLIELGA